MPDNVNHPSHYETGKFECIEVMQEALGTEAVINFCICNAFKYLYRHGRKNGDEDIKKAQWYINKYLELAEEVNHKKAPDKNCDNCLIKQFFEETCDAILKSEE